MSKNRGVKIQLLKLILRPIYSLQCLETLNNSSSKCLWGLVKVSMSQLFQFCNYKDLNIVEMSQNRSKWCSKTTDPRSVITGNPWLFISSNYQNCQIKICSKTVQILNATCSIRLSIQKYENGKNRQKRRFLSIFASFHRKLYFFPFKFLSRSRKFFLLCTKTMISDQKPINRLLF